MVSNRNSGNPSHTANKIVQTYEYMATRCRQQLPTTMWDSFTAVTNYTRVLLDPCLALCEKPCGLCPHSSEGILRGSRQATTYPSLPQRQSLQLRTRAKVTGVHRLRCWADVWAQVVRVVATGAEAEHRLLWSSPARVHNRTKPWGGRRPVHD